MKRSYFFVVVWVAVLAFTAGVRADFTPILYGDPPGLLTDPGGVLDTLYGLENLQRIDDFNASITDQVWYNPGSGTATAKAKYAGLTHDFGYFPGASGGSFVTLFSTGGSMFGYYTSGSEPTGTFTVAQSGPQFRFGLDIIDSPDLWSSLQSENDQGWDHMVSFLITGGPSEGNYVVGWEDLNLGDQDYDDLVFEFEGVSPGPPVPEATTLMLFGSGLPGLLLYAKRKRLIKF